MIRNIPHPPANPHPSRQRRALTYMELLIALSITAVVCGILAVLINATAMGTSTQNDGRRSLVRLQTLKSALDDELINARAILATGTNYVVYWTGDRAGAVTVANNAVNYSEMRLLEVDSSGNLNLYQINWPAGSNNSWITTYDSTCATGSNWYSLCGTLKTTGYYPATVLATGVTALSVSLDSATVTSAHMINFRIDIADGTTAGQKLVLGVTLANPLSPY